MAEVSMPYTAEEAAGSDVSKKALVTFIQTNASSAVSGSASCETASALPSGAFSLSSSSFRVLLSHPRPSVPFCFPHYSRRHVFLWIGKGAGKRRDEPNEVKRFDERRCTDYY